MSEESNQPRFREHVKEIGGALAGIGKDVEINVTQAPRRAKEGTKNAFARAAGIRRTPMREWEESDSPPPK